MLTDLTVEQRRLADLMIEISEKCYSAGWIKNLEYLLWDALTNEERKLGRDIISESDIDQLKQLSQDCNCWIYFDDKEEESPIELESWRDKFEKGISENLDSL